MEYITDICILYDGLGDPEAPKNTQTRDLVPLGTPEKT